METVRENNQVGSLQVLPGPRPRPLVGNIPDLTKHRCFYRNLTELSKQFGPYFEVKLPGEKWLITSDAKLTRDLLITNQNLLIKGGTLKEVSAMSRGIQSITEMDGKKWEHFRNFMSPFFAKKQFMDRDGLLESICQESIESLKRHQNVNSYNFMYRLAYRAACELILSHAPDCLKEPEKPYPFLENQLFLVDQLLIRMQRTPMWKHLPIPSNFRVKNAVKKNGEYWMEALRDRIANPGLEKGDFFDALLKGRDGDGQPLSTDLLLVLAHGVIGGAFESSAALLHWGFHELSKNPKLQMEIQQELKGQEIRFSNVKSFPRLMSFVTETLRYYTPFPLYSREVIGDIDVGFPIQKGQKVFFLIGRMIKDPSVWGEDGEQFNPHRFLDREMTKEQKQSFTPYGIGKRFCIGSNLADVELPFLFARHIQELTVRPRISYQPVGILKFTYISNCGIPLKFVGANH